jgi:release factor glutamine methyltransferase
MTLKSWLEAAYRRLKEAGFPGPRAEAEWLAAAVLDRSRAQLVTMDQDPLPADAAGRLEAALERRQAGESLAYIVGYKDFFKHRFAAGPGVLVPRPETELLVETALALKPQLNPAPLIADFGAGTGCIGLSLLLEWPDAKLVAVETSAAASEYLRRNIGSLGLAARVRLENNPVENFTGGNLDLVVANPPYIAADDPQVEPGVRRFEPPEALFAADRGFSAIRGWARVAGAALKAGGFLLMEVGAGQARELGDFGPLKLESIKKDLAGIERAVIWRKM